jgi:restriction system protein
LRGEVKKENMSKKKKGHADFIKWFGPVLEALQALGGSAKPREIAEWIGTAQNIPDEILNARYEKSGQLKFPNQIAWARQYLVWEELLDSSKHGVWALTPKGWNTNLNEAQSYDIFLKWVKIFQDLRDNKETIEGETQNVVKTQETTDFKEGEILYKPSLIEVLQSISTVGFEHLCGRLLKEYNFENIEITQRSHDGGIDGYATLKLNPFVSLSVFFQCKRYQGTVPTEKVQAFIGVMETNKRSVEKGLMITTGSFAKSAIEIEKANIKLELIDGEKLVEMFENVELGVIPKTIYEPNMNFFEQYRDMK